MHTPFTQNDLETIHDLIHHEGWELMKNILDSTFHYELEHVDTVEELWNARGSREVVDFVMSIEYFLDQAMLADVN